MLSTPDSDCSPGIQSKLRDEPYSKVQDEKGHNTEQRLLLGIKGMNLLWIHLPCILPSSPQRFPLGHLFACTQGLNLNRVFAFVISKGAQRSQEIVAKLNIFVALLQ